ncbi:MAG: nucleotidyltransferase domain-containing protein [Bdellovibrionota bacterium]
MFEQEISIEKKIDMIILEYVSKNLLKNNNDIKAVFLVGSAARGELSRISDIDLLIITNKKLSDDQQDNMRSDVYKGLRFSMLYTNLSLLKEGVSQEIPATITFIIDAKVIYDPDALLKTIKSLLNDFKLSNNLKEEIISAENRLSILKDASLENQNFNILMTSIDLAREFLCLNNDPYMAVKHLYKHLSLYNNSYAESFREIWKCEDECKVIKIFEKQIANLNKLKDCNQCKNNNINIIPRIENAEEALNTAKYLLNNKNFEAVPIVFSETYYLYRGFMEYLGHDFDILTYENFFSLLNMESPKLLLSFSKIWQFFDHMSILKILKKQIEFLKNLSGIIL